MPTTTLVGNTHHLWLDKKEKSIHDDKSMGVFHLLSIELQKTAIMTTREGTKSDRKIFDDTLANQLEK